MTGPYNQRNDGVILPCFLLQRQVFTSGKCCRYGPTLRGHMGLLFGEPSVQFSLVAQSCPTLCDPTNCSMPGLPVHHQLWNVLSWVVNEMGCSVDGFCKTKMHPHSALVLHQPESHDCFLGCNMATPNNNNNNNTNDSKHCHQLVWSRQRPFDLEVSKHVANVIQQLVSLSPFYREKMRHKMFKLRGLRSRGVLLLETCEELWLLRLK